MTTIDVNKLEAKIEAVLQSWKVPGGAVSIVKDGEILSARGYGSKNAETGEPVDADTVFCIGSNTKSFTAAGIAALVDDGKVAWSDPIRKHLPDFELRDPWVTEHITIRDMLSHRSGLGRSMRILYNHVFDLAEVVRRMRYMPFIAPFRDAFGYNNYHFMVAGRVIEAASGLTWPQFMKERIFAPLGMNRSGAVLAHLEGMDNISAAHDDIHDSPLPQETRIFTQDRVIPWSDVGNQPAGGIFSSANDLTHWMKMLLNGGLHEGEQFLSTKVITEMSTPVSTFKDPLESDLGFLAAMQPEINFYTYGLGWFVLDFKGRKMFFHGGQIHGFNAMVVLFPQEKLGFTILTNAHHTFAHAALTFIISDAFLGGTPRAWNEEMLGMAAGMIQGAEAQVEERKNKRKADTQSSLPLSAYTGVYENDFVGRTKVGLKEGKLSMRYGTAFAGSLEHWECDTFRAVWEDRTFNPNWVEFEIADKGEVSALTVSDEGLFKKIA